MRGVIGNDAYDSIATLTQQNIERWRSVQDDIFKVMSGAATQTRKEQRAEDTETDSRS